MKFRFLIFAFIVSGNVAFSQGTFAEVYTKAREEYKNKDYSNFSQHIAEALKLHPYHQGVLYYSGVAAAINSKPEEAVAFLKKSILIDSRYNLEDENLNSLKGRKDFAELLQLKGEMEKPVINSDTALLIKDRQLHAEGIAYDNKSKAFFLGSIQKRKIIRIDASGKVADFVAPTAEMAGVFGLKIDSKHKHLWACSSPIEEMSNYDASVISRIFKYGLPDGKLIASYEVPSDVKGSVFGDLVLSAKDEVYVSDGTNNIIFKVDEATKKLERYFESKEFANIQGIVFSDDNATMFIADYVRGLFKLDLKSRQLSKVNYSVDASLKGIDGLNYYKGGLIAIQNGVNPLRAVYLTLDNHGDIVSFKTIDRENPAFGEPTLGTVDGDTLYYIANSQWGGYDESHKILPADKLHDIVILKTDLKKIKK